MPIFLANQDQVDQFWSMTNAGHKYAHPHQ